MLSPPPAAAIMARRGVKGLPLLHLNMASHALAKKKNTHSGTSGGSGGRGGGAISESSLWRHIAYRNLFRKQNEMHYWGWQKLNICFFLKFSEALNIVRGSEIFVNIYKYIYTSQSRGGSQYYPWCIPPRSTEDAQKEKTR